MSGMVSRVFVVTAVTVFLSLCPRQTSAEDEAEPDKGVPTELKGFQGMMTGTLVEKGEAAIVFKIGTIKKVWKGNKAENPKAAVGKTVSLTLDKVSDHHRKRIMSNFRTLADGDQIELEAFDLGEATLCIKEWLKKAEAKETD